MQLALLVAVLVCNVGGEGSPQQAQPVLETFLRHLEASGGFAAKSLHGRYVADGAACSAAFKKDRPAILVCDLPTYLARKRSWKLAAVAHMGGLAKRYYLLVRKDHQGGLPALKGKLLVAPLARDPAFLTRVVLAGKVPVTHFSYRTSRRPLRGIRKVARGQAAATVVDERAYGHLAELGLADKLQVLAKSAQLPGLTLTVVGRAKGGFTAKLQRALPALCRGDGQKLCKTFGVSSFTKANGRVLSKLLRYRKGR